MTKLPAFRGGKPRTERGHVRPIEGIDIPYAVIEGEAPGPCLLVTAGVHGSEYCSIEAALRLMHTEPGTIKGSLVILPILNMSAFRQRSIYVMPEDGRNLNRMFPGRPDGTLSERLAHWLVSEVYPHVDATLDLHGGDLDEALVSFSLFPAGNERAKAIAMVFGLPVTVVAGGEGYTINAAHRLGVPGIIAEVSGNGLWNEASVGEMRAGIARVMRHLGMISGPAPSAGATPQVVTMWVPKAPTSGLWYPAKELSEPVAQGESLGEIRDVFGKVLAVIPSDKTGFILYRLTSLAVNQGEALLGVATPVAT